MKKYGRFVVVGICLGALVVGGVFYALLKNSSLIMNQTGDRIQKTFLADMYTKGAWEIAGVPIPHEPWSFAIEGDHLVVQAPPMYSDLHRESIRTEIEHMILEHLSKMGSPSSKPVMVEVHFAND